MTPESCSVFLRKKKGEKKMLMIIFYIMINIIYAWILAGADDFEDAVAAQGGVGLFLLPGILLVKAADAVMAGKEGADV